MKENKHFTVGTLQEFSMVRNIQKSSDCKVHGHIPIGDQSLFWKRIIIFKSSTKMRGFLFQIKRIEFYTQTILYIINKITWIHIMIDKCSTVAIDHRLKVRLILSYRLSFIQITFISFVIPFALFIFLC